MPEQDTTAATGNEPVKFNMGLATLEEINHILVVYHKVNIFGCIEDNKKEFKLDNLEAQIIKINICHTLLVAARPLLKDEQKNNLSQQLKSIKIYQYDKTKGVGDIRVYTPVFHPLVDKLCNDFVSLLIDELQKNKVFMPGKGEHGLF